jgi:outer membrane biosynthesis protein TonB
VPNPQNFADTSNPTVVKLLEADAFLATTEAQLNAQLQSIQEKRKSLKTVIDLFAPTDTAIATEIAIPAQTAVVAEAEAEVVAQQAEPPAKDEVTPELDTTKTDTTADVETPTVPDTQKRQTKKNSAPAGKKPSAKSLPKQKASKEQETWQQYLRSEFSNATLATAVSEVMQKQPSQVLNTAAIVDAIFVDEIPREVRSKARELVSNVLSVGVKKEKWYRGEVGSYSMSKAAV